MNPIASLNLTTRSMHSKESPAASQSSSVCLPQHSNVNGTPTHPYHVSQSNSSPKSLYWTSIIPRKYSALISGARSSPRYPNIGTTSSLLRHVAGQRFPSEDALPIGCSNYRKLFPSTSIARFTLQENSKVSGDSSSYSATSLEGGDLSP